MTVPHKKEDSQRTIRCLVIQMTRLGDTLQSLMALRAAKELYPQLEIHFLAREKFASAAKRVTWIKKVIPLPTDELLKPVLLGEKSEIEALGSVARWISPLVKEPWDLIVNWSYSDSSSYLTGILPGRVKLGYTRRRDESIACADGWSHYIQAIVQGEVSQNIHLTDILTTQLLTALQIHYGEPTQDGNTPVTSKSFFSLELGDKELGLLRHDSTKNWVALQLGAGREDKTWDPVSWAKLAGYVLRRHPNYNVVLLGGPEDAGRAETFLAELQGMKDLKDPKRVLSLVGKTSFDLWASVVSRCQWLLAGDTAAIHLASVLGTRVLNLSIGPVRWAETGPYGNGHYVIAPTRAGKADITPEVVYGTWSYAASEWSHRRQSNLEHHFTQLGWSEALGFARVYRSRIRSTNDGGGVHYEAMTATSLPVDQWSAMVMGHIARSWYCGWVPPIGQELPREMISPELVKRLRELRESSEVLAKIYEEARQTASQLNQKSLALRSQKLMPIRDRETIQDLGRKLQELDALVTRLAKTHAPLLAFAQMSKVLMHNLRGAGLADLGRESADCYRQLAEGVAIYKEWLKFTLELARPVAVKPQTLSLAGPGPKPPGKELNS